MYLYRCILILPIRRKQNVDCNIKTGDRKLCQISLSLREKAIQSDKPTCCDTISKQWLEDVKTKI